MRYFYALFIMISMVNPLLGMENFDSEKWEQEIEALWSKISDDEIKQIFKDEIKKFSVDLSKLASIKNNVAKLTKKAGKIIVKIEKCTGLCVPGVPGIPAQIATQVCCDELFAPISAALKNGNYKLARQMSFILAKKVGVETAEHNDLRLGYQGADYL